MSLGLGQLRLPPEIFWRLTLPELAAAARALRPVRQHAMSRQSLRRMMLAFPDERCEPGQ
ncbi:MAG: phage tail assembly chaperone [Parvibaculaceae bacterium]|nr:phage tail assembly chaperone [Parvibaculaceae bacterium]